MEQRSDNTPLMDNPELALARRYVEHTHASLFLTGKAGTGKTTFLRQLDSEVRKRHVVLAPTGVAAVNAGGVTIHSFFQLPFDPYLPDVPELLTEYQMPRRKGLTRNKINIIRTLELLIIDEVSMVRADLLDAVDAQLRRYRHSSRPFGGVQLLLIGDVHQLSPVVKEAERPYIERFYPSPYFFCSKALQKVGLITIELTHVYRQQDAAFVELLNRVRDNCIDATTLQLLNSRVGTPPEGAITLTTHNRQADAINQSHFEALPGKARTFTAIVDGTFPESMMPVEQRLKLKVGERVMFLRNDSSGARRYFNGKLATVKRFIDGDALEVEDDDGETLRVGREVWENIRYALGKQNQIEQKVEGKFAQLPLRPAWAVTIHKAQGLTFDRVVISAAEAFAFGQVYVALSRCRTLEGLTLLKPLSEYTIFDDKNVAGFISTQTSLKEAQEQLNDHEEQYYFEQLSELFSVEALLHDSELLAEAYSNALHNLYPTKVQAMQGLLKVLIDLSIVSEKFRNQLSHLPRENHADRIAKGAEYYLSQLKPLRDSLPALMAFELDNQASSDLITERAQRCYERLVLKVDCLRAVVDKGFSIDTLQKAKTDSLLRDHKMTSRVASAQPTIDDLEGKHSYVAKSLRGWRAGKAAETGLPPYTILQQKALIGIAKALPTTPKELLAVNGVGKVVAQRYGEEILDIVRQVSL